MLPSPRRPIGRVFVANPAEVCASAGHIGRLTKRGCYGRRISSRRRSAPYLGPLASDGVNPSCRVTNLGIELGAKRADENSNRAGVGSPRTNGFT